MKILSSTKITQALLAADDAMRSAWGADKVDGMNDVYRLGWQVELAAAYLVGRSSDED